MQSMKMKNNNLRVGNNKFILEVYHYNSLIILIKFFFQLSIAISELFIFLLLFCWIACHKIRKLFLFKNLINKIKAVSLRSSMNLASLYIFRNN